MQLSVAQVIEEGAKLRGGVLYLAEVMHAHVPLVSGPAEGMRVATGRVVPLQHQNSFAAVLGEQGGRGQASDARTDNNRVPAFFERVLLVRNHGNPPMLTLTT